MATAEQPYPQISLPLPQIVGLGRLERLIEWLRFRLAWLAGADMRILREVPEDKPFHDRLGVLVLLATAGSGVALTYWTSVSLGFPMAQIWYVGLIWWVFLLCLEPLLLDIVATSGRALFGALSLRIVVSLVIAGLFAEPILIAAFDRPITNVLTKQDIVAIHNAEATINTTYDTKISGAQAQITQILNNERTLENKIIDRTKEKNCETQLQACAESHQGLGCGPYCIQARQKASQYQATLDRIKPADQKAIAAHNADIAGWRIVKKKELHTRRQAILNSHDLLTREQALWTIGARSGVAFVETWSIRIALLALDLMALGLKCAHLRTSSYKLYAAARRRRESVKAYVLDEETEVIRERIRREAEAAKQVDATRIDVETDRQIADLEADWSERPGSHRRRRGEPVAARPLDEYNEHLSSRESRPVQVPRGLRLAGFVGTGLIAVLTVSLGFYSYRTGRIVSGEWVAGVGLTATVGLASYTRGFSTAPAWALRATFATLLTGLFLPVVLLAMNV
jgi:hypothetical protein